MPHSNARRNSRRRASPAHDGLRHDWKRIRATRFVRASGFTSWAPRCSSAHICASTRSPRQVLIDDEWHAVHQFIAHTPREMFVDFGYADYSIPLGILGWFEAQWWGVSELTLRSPMLVCGLATLVVLPLYVAPRLGTRHGGALRAAARDFAAAGDLHAHGAAVRDHAVAGLDRAWRLSALPRVGAPAGGAAGATYATAAALATWLHPVVGPVCRCAVAVGIVPVAACAARQAPPGLLRAG